MGLNLHVRQILEKEADIISGHKVVCLRCFHNAVDHRIGLCTGRRVAEQPVLSADSKGADLVLCTIVGDLAARILQIVFHIRALSLSVLHRLFQAASQWLCAEFIQPAPKSPEHRLFDRKALFLLLFRRKALYFFFSCKELVTKVPTNLCRRRCVAFRWHSLHELSSQMRPTVAACDMRDLVISGISIGVEITVETFQKSLGIVSAAAGLVIIQDDRRQTVIAGAVQPHIGFRGRSLAFLLQHLHGGFICVQYFPLQQFFPHCFPDRNQPVLGTADRPVCHGRTAECYIPAFPLLLLPVQRNMIHKFLVDHLCHHRRRSHAVVQQRLRSRDRFCCQSACLLAAEAVVGVLPVAIEFEFCGNEFRDFPDHIFAQQFHLRSAVGTVPLFRRNVEIDILDLDTLAQLPLFQCIQNMVATGILLNRLFGFRFIFLLCLIKQTKLLFCRFRLLTGWAKLLFAQQSEQFIHIPNLI